jgi:hypothetical protein
VIWRWGRGIGTGGRDLRSVRSHLEQKIRYPTSTLHAQRQSPALRIINGLKEYVLRLFCYFSNLNDDLGSNATACEKNELEDLGSLERFLRFPFPIFDF